VGRARFESYGSALRPRGAPHHPDCTRVPDHEGHCALVPGHPDLESDVFHLRRRLVRAEHKMIYHSAFAYPHFWLWHALFDGTRLCGCWRSREMKAKSGPPVERS
jgi:hypothetical protein